MTDYKEELSDLLRKGLLRSLVSLDDSALVNFSSNDYLGLSHHPEVRKAAEDALQKYGTGSGASRLLAGTFSLHRELEEALARFLKKEAALVFSSGYHTNTGILPVVATAKDAVFFDHLSHASLIDGVKLSAARFFSFQHNDPDHLEELLRKNRSRFRRAFVASEGIFSMDGDRTKVEALTHIVKKYDADFYLDEAHSLGVVGPEGRGIAAEKNLWSDVDIHVGTLSKVLGSQGGFVAGPKDLIELIISKSRSFIYSTSLAPASAGAALAALRLLPSMEGERAEIQEASKNLREALAEAGYSTGRSDSQIVPVMTGDLETTKNLSNYLLSKGFFVPSIRPPTVPAGEGRVRLSVTRGVVGPGLSRLIEAFKSYPTRPQFKGEPIVKVR